MDFCSFQTQVIVISAYRGNSRGNTDAHCKDLSFHFIYFFSISPSITSLFPSIIVKSRLEKLFDTPI